MHCLMKIHLRAHFMKQWRNHWDYSGKGKYTYDLVPVVSLDLLQVTLSTTTFLIWSLGPLGHGPFGAYLFKFKRDLALLCECGDVADISHRFYSCSLTTRWYIRRHSLLSDAWLASISSRPTLLSKIKNISNYLCNLFVLLNHWDRV